MANIQQWRDFFATAPNKATVFDVLDQAITVAASAFPDEFSRQKSRILGLIQSETPGCGVPARAQRHIIRIKFKMPAAMDQEKSAAEPLPCVVEPTNKAKACLDEEAMEGRLEATKRKMHERYEEIENAKRQKRIQVLNYAPKQEFNVATRENSKKKKKAAGNHCRKQQRVADKSLLGRLVSASH